MKGKNEIPPDRVPGLQLALVLSLVFNVIFTFLKESIPSLKNLLHNLFLNSWLGQLLLISFLFFVMTFLFQYFPIKPRLNFFKVFPILLCICLVLLFLYYALNPGK